MRFKINSIDSNKFYLYLKSKVREGGCSMSINQLQLKKFENFQLINSGALKQLYIDVINELKSFINIVF